MTTDTMPSRPRAVTRPRPQPAPEPGRRAARVRPYHRHPTHRQNRPARLVRPAAPMRDRAVLGRVLAGLRRLPEQPAAQSSAPWPAPPPSADTNTATSISAFAGGRVVGDVSPVPDDPFARSLLGRELMPLVRAVLARRPEAAQPAARVEPSPDAVRTEPLVLVGVAS